MLELAVRSALAAEPDVEPAEPVEPVAPVFERSAELPVVEVAPLLRSAELPVVVEEAVLEPAALEDVLPVDELDGMEVPPEPLAQDASTSVPE